VQLATTQKLARYWQTLKELGINLPEPPEPFGTYVDAATTKVGIAPMKVALPAIHGIGLLFLQDTEIVEC
jgi:hypothetical protein